jgi:hypothetical protein
MSTDKDHLLFYRAKLLAALEAQPLEFEALSAARPEPEWHTRRLADGATPHQIAVHVRDIDRLAFLPRFRRILAEANPRLEAFPSHRWSLDGYDPSEPLRRLLADFARSRAETLTVLRGMSDDDWSRAGFHPPSGPRTLQWWAERMYRHTHDHLAEIHRTLSDH